jgi:hypothetical protein
MRIQVNRRNKIPAESPTRAPPGNMSFGIDWRPPSERARAEEEEND